MASGIHRLNVKKIDAHKRGWLCDGGGLYVCAKGPESKSWVFRYTVPGTGKTRYMGLGSLNDVTLAEARDKAAEQQKLRGSRAERFQGIDPLDARKEANDLAKLEQARQMTFQQCAEQYIRTRSTGWRPQTIENHKLLERHAYPVIGDLPVQKIDTPDVMRVLEPRWSEIPSTLYSLASIIERILDWATTAGMRSGDNPSRWQKHLQNLLPPPGKVKPVKHHPAMPYAEVPAFMAEVVKIDTRASLALQFIMLTTVRAREGADVRWTEIDPDKALWTIPAARMKTHKEFAVPLSRAALDVLERAKRFKVRGNDLVFPGARHGRGIAKWNIVEIIRKCAPKVCKPVNGGEPGRDKDGAWYTVHGFRGSFRTWAQDSGRFRYEAYEMALSHDVGGSVERSYQHSKMIDDQRKLKEQWGVYCTTPRPVVVEGEVIQMGKKRRA